MVAWRHYLIGLCLIPMVIFADMPEYQLPLIEVNSNSDLRYSQSANLGNQTTIDSAQIASSGANNLTQVLNNIAGVQSFSGLSASPEVFINALPATILVDGQSLTNFSTSNPDINLIPLAEIDKIIITSGSAGSLYGNQSLGGTINIITKLTQQTEKSLTAILGMPFTRQISGLITEPIDAHWSYRADIQNQYDEGYRVNNSQNSSHAGLTLTEQDKQNSWTINLRGLHQNLNYAGYLTDKQVAADPTQSFASQGQGGYSADTGSLSVDWIRHFNVIWQAESKLSYRQQDANSLLYGSFNQKYSTASINPQLNGSLSMGQRQLPVNLGLSVINETYSFESPTLYSNIKGANQQQYNAYGSIIVPITQQLTWSTQARTVIIDTYGQFYNSNSNLFNPPSSQVQHIHLLTMGLNDQLNSQWSVYLRRAMGYQLPFIDESNYTSNPNTGFGLQATTSTSYETGMNWQGNLNQINFEAFMTKLDNEIGYYVPSNGIAANYNLPPTQREGISIDGQYEPNFQWTLGFHETLLSNQFLNGPDSGKEIPGASNVLSDFTASYQINRIWSIYNELQYTGSQYAQGDNDNVSSKIPGYWLWNLAINANYHVWLWSFRVDNLANTQYNLATVYDAYIAVPHDNDVAYYPAPGRSAWLSVTYRFE